MKCENCLKNFETPLMLYNGKIACPLCGKPMREGDELKVTYENEEYYRISEACFYRYLENPKDRSYIKRAVEHCTSAAHGGHPAATVRLGYYYETGYADGALARTERNKIAYGYYRAVCMYDKPLVVATGINGYDEDGFRNIKEIAAKRMWNIIARNIGSYKGDPERTKSGVAAVKSKLSGKFPSLRLNDIDAEPSAFEETGLDNKLQSCFDTVRAPLFGISAISAQEFGAGVPAITRAANGGLYLWHVARSGADYTFYALTNASQVSGYAKGLTGDGYLFFFNRCGKHKYLKSAALDVVEKDLTGDGKFRIIKRLIAKGGGSDFTFFDDDIMAHRSGKSVSGAAEELVADVIKDVDLIN